MFYVFNNYLLNASFFKKERKLKCTVSFRHQTSGMDSIASPISTGRRYSWNRAHGRPCHTETAVHEEVCGWGSLGFLQVGFSLHSGPATSTAHAPEGHPAAGGGPALTSQYSHPVREVPAHFLQSDRVSCRRPSLNLKGTSTDQQGILY